MITFIVSLLLLVAGYFFYGKLVEKVFHIDSKRKTPAILKPDGVDYIAMPWWKLFLIQFLNIAGVGPIFGAVMGMMFGPSAFLWIVFGTIFAGAVHDFTSRMISIRQDGASLTEIVGSQLGSVIRIIFTIFTVFLLILVGAVFVQSPASLLTSQIASVPMWVWVVVIFAYYLLATLLPIDKIIGRFYPIFGAILLFMAAGIMFMMLFHTISDPNISMPEVWDGLKSQHPKGYPIFPMMFVSIACGAISGFHASQSPLVARCIENEKYGRRVFYGAMVLEGIVALIWAAVAGTYFHGIDGLLSFAGEGKGSAEIVSEISVGWLGKVGGFIAILGVIAAAITSGDTALRSARLSVADFIKYPQEKVINRLIISLPIFALSAFILFGVKFEILWRYFAWCNQTLSIFTLWACSIWLFKNKRAYFITMIPAMFMTAVCFTYILYAPEGMGLNYTLSYIVGLSVAVVFMLMFFYWGKKYRINNAG